MRLLDKHGVCVCVCVCMCVCARAYLGYVSHKTTLVGHSPYESKHTSICWCGTTECWLKLQHSLPFQDDVASKVHCELHTPAVHRSCSSVETHVAGMMACDVCDLHVSTHRPVVFGNSSMTCLQYTWQVSSLHCTTQLLFGGKARSQIPSFRVTVQDTQCHQLERNLNAQMLANDFAYN